MSLAPNQISFINISVSGEGMAPKVWTWDAHTACLSCSHNSPPSAPTATTFTDIPTSGAKTVQVLVVPQGENNNDIYYGEAQKQLNTGSDSVALTATNIGSTGGEGMVGGRFYRAGGVNPTIRMRAFAHPVVNGVERPPMAMWTSDMVAGWFQVFFIDGFRFSYVNELDKNDVIFSAATLPEMKAAATGQNSKGIWGTPPYYGSSSSTNPTGLRGKRHFVLGHFGDATSIASRYACKESGITDSEVFDPYSFSGVLGLKLLNYDGAGYDDTTTPYKMGPINVTASVGFCGTTANSFSTVLYYRPNYPNKESRAFGINGPFRMISDVGEGDFHLREDTEGIKSVAGSVQTTLGWRFLPGTGSAIDGAVIFARAGQLESDGGGPNGIQCASLEPQGFRQVGPSVPWSSSPVSQVVTEAHLSSAGLNPYALPALNFVICPYKDGANIDGSRRYYKPIIAKGPSSNGGSNGSEPAFYFSLVPDSFDDAFGDTVACRKYWIELFKPDGTAYTPTASTNLYFNAWSTGGSPTVTSWTTNNCTTTSTSTIPVTATSTVFSIKGSGSGTSLFKMTINRTSGGGSGGGNSGDMSNYKWLAYDDGGIPDTTTSTFVVQGGTPMTKGSCNSIYIRRNGASGLTTDTTSFTPITLTRSGTLPGNYYFDSQCSGSPITSASLGANDPYRVVYYRPKTEAGSVSLDVANGGTTGSLAAVPLQKWEPYDFFSSVGAVQSCKTVNISVRNDSTTSVSFKRNVPIQYTISTADEPVDVYTSFSDCQAGSASGSKYKGQAVNGTPLVYTETTSSYSSSLELFIRNVGTAASNASVTIGLSVTGAAPAITGSITPSVSDTVSGTP